MIIGSNYDAPVRELLSSNPGGRKVVDLCTGAGHWCVICHLMCLLQPSSVAMDWVNFCAQEADWHAFISFFTWRIRDIMPRIGSRCQHCHINDLSGSWKWPENFPSSNFVDLILVRVSPF